MGREQIDYGGRHDVTEAVPIRYGCQTGRRPRLSEPPLLKFMPHAARSYRVR